MTIEYYKTGGPAFPTTAENYSNYHPSGDGMTLRDYFAAKAMQALLNAWVVKAEGDGDWGAGDAVLARGAYEIADAMLEARQRAPT